MLLAVLIIRLMVIVFPLSAYFSLNSWGHWRIIYKTICKTLIMKYGKVQLHNTSYSDIIVLILNLIKNELQPNLYSLSHS
jgi:hypothetical protein